jgi:hypothetical protein
MQDLASLICGFRLRRGTELHTHDEPAPIVIESERLKCIIQNAHRLLKNKYRGQPLWVIVSELTGHGSQISAQLCRQCGLEPDAKCGSKSLVNTPEAND